MNKFFLRTTQFFLIIFLFFVSGNSLSAQSILGGSTPFGGSITLVTQCTCSGNYFITLSDVYSSQIKNILVYPPISKLYREYTFNVGQYALGTYTDMGIPCLIYAGQQCVEITVDGVIDSSPGAGSSGSYSGSSIGVPAGGSSFSSLISGLFTSLGETVVDTIVAGGTELARSEINKLLNPGPSRSSSGTRQSQRVRGEAKNTFFSDEANFNSGGRTSPVLDRQGNVIAQADSQFLNNRGKGTLRNDGVGILRDGTVIVRDGTVNGVPRYFVQENGIGYGTTGIPLQPFRSIAVDPSSIPIGSLVRIPETEGMVLLDGTSHNGIWSADTAGEGLEGYEIIFFIGTEGNRVFLDAEGISNQERLTIILLE